MLHSQREVFLREVEHVEDDGLRASVLAVVDGAYHLYDGLALMHHLRLSVLSDDGQLALHEHAVVHGHMVVPAQLLTGGEHILHGHQFGAALEVVGQFHAVPALAGTDQFGGLHLLCGSGVFFFNVSLLAGGQRETYYRCAANGAAPTASANTMP